METVIREIAKNIYDTLGPGYSERVYHNAFEVSLRKRGVPYESERIIPIMFEGHTIGNVRADLIVDGTWIVELKSVKGSLNSANDIQIRQYMNLTGVPNGLLVNFSHTECEINLVLR